MPNAEYSGIDLKISADSSNAIKNIESLKKMLASISTIANDKNGSASNIKNLGDGVNKLSNALSKLSKMKIDDNAMGRTLTRIKNISAQLSQVGAENSQGITQLGNGVSKIANTFNKLGKLNANSFKGFSDSLKNMRTILSSISDEDVAKLDKIAMPMYLLSKTNPSKALKNSANATKDTAKDVSDKKKGNNYALIERSVQNLGGAFKQITGYASKAYSTVGRVASAISGRLTSSLTSAVKKMNDLKSAIGRIALYRAMRTVIKNISAGIQEGLQNAYYWANETGNKFASSMDSIATSANYAKNSLGAMAAPIYNALAPVIDAIIDKFVALVNIINQVFSLLGGSGKWIKAIKQPKKYAAAVGGIGGAAKGAKKQLDLFLASFDELHLTNKSNGSSGGGGGGGSGGGSSYGDMFEYEDISSDIKKWMNTDDWTDLGKTVGEKLNVITKSMDDWINHKFRPFLKTWSTRLATFLNGFMETYDFERLGKLMADGLNALIDGANTFMETFNSYNFGKSIAKVIDGWFKYVDWNNLARYFSNKLQTFVNVAQGFVDELMPNAFANGYRIGTMLKDIFNSIQWEQIRETLSTGLHTIARFMEGFFSGQDGSFDNFGKEFCTTIKSVLENPDTSIIIEGVASFINSFIDILDDAALWFDVGEAVGKALGAIDWGNALKVAIEAIGSAFTGLFAGLFEEDHGTAFLGVVAAVSTIKGAFSIARQSLVKAAIDTFADKISNGLISSIKTDIQDSVEQGALDGIGDTLKTRFSTIASNVVTALPTLGWVAVGAGIIAAIGLGFSEMAQPTYQEKLKEIDELQDDFYQKYGMNETQYMQKYGVPALQEAYNKLTGLDDVYHNTSLNSQQSWLKDTTGTFSDMSAQSNATVSDAYSKMNATTTDSNSAMSQNTTLTWDKIKSFLGNTWNGLKQTTSTSFNHIKTTIGNAWSNVKSNASNTWNTIKSNLSEKFSEISSNAKNSFEGMKNTVAGKFDSIKSKMTTPIESAKNRISGIVDTIKGFFSNMHISIPHIPLPHFSVSPRGWEIGDLLKGKIPRLGIEWYAQGGFPDAGQLFIAREAGAEMVGNIGGRTAVANNDQIVSAVSSGVYKAVMSAMNGNSGNGGNINLTVNLDGKVVYKDFVKRHNQEVKQTGESPLLV